MTDAFFDAARSEGEYPPKGWGWKDDDQQRKALAKHFWQICSHIDPWMKREAARLGLPLPKRSIEDAEVYMPIVYGVKPNPSAL